MIVNIVTLLALACVVHASVIINVFDDGDIESSQSVSNCNPSDCDSFCRRAGFNKGECVGNRCRCTLYPTISEQKDGHLDLDSCNYQGCDQQCRRLGFPGGACVGDRCVCDNFEPMIIKSKALNHLLHRKTVTKTPQSLDDCNFQACDQLCRNLGFPGGACIGDRCDCDNFKNDEKGHKVSTEAEVSASAKVSKKLINLQEALTAAGLGYCDIVNCDDMCHRLNYAGGTCIGGSCNCY